MRSLWQAPAIVVSFMAWLASPPGGLADAARRESLRRAAVPPSVASLSNMNLPVVAEPPSQATAIAPLLPPAPPAPPTVPPVRDEQWWRARMTEARSTLERHQVLAAAVQSRINALQTDIVNRDDPAQQAALKQQLVRALSELERLKAEIAADLETIAEIEADARRQGVPPGWIR